MIIYHNPRCTKSREGLAFLEEKGRITEVREYLKETFSRDELAEVIQKLGITPSELLRKNEQVYKDQFKGKSIQEEEWIDIMLEYPKLIERPIVVNGNKAVIARPKEKIEEIL